MPAPAAGFFSVSLTQLVQVLEQELQQLLAARGASPSGSATNVTPSTIIPPQSSSTITSSQGAPTCQISGPDSATIGQTITLTWTSSNAISATLDLDAQVVTPVPVSGSYTVAIGTDAQDTYILAVQNNTHVYGSCAVHVNISQPTPSGSSTATIDQTSLTPSSAAFSITGSAKNANLVYVVILQDAYVGSSDTTSVNTAIINYFTKQSSVFGAAGDPDIAPAANGHWSVAFANVPKGMYKVFVYDDTNSTSQGNKPLIASGLLNVEY